MTIRLLPGREPTLAAQVVAPDASVVWDEFIVAYALGLARGHEVPRPRLQTDLSFSHPATVKRNTWLDAIDTYQVWRDFTRKIDSRARSRQIMSGPRRAERWTAAYAV